MDIFTILKKLQIIFPKGFKYTMGHDGDSYIDLYIDSAWHNKMFCFDTLAELVNYINEEYKQVIG